MDNEKNDEVSPVGFGTVEVCKWRYFAGLYRNPHDDVGYSKETIVFTLVNCPTCKKKIVLEGRELGHKAWNE